MKSVKKYALIFGTISICAGLIVALLVLATSHDKRDPPINNINNHFSVDLVSDFYSDASALSSGTSGSAKSIQFPQHHVVACMESVFHHLPMKAARSGTCALAVHQLEARTGKWNEEIRFSEFPVHLSNTIQEILYVGGNTHAADAEVLCHLLSQVHTVHVLEPVQKFYTQLVKVHASNAKIKVYNVGIGSKTQVVELPISKLQGDATFVMDSTNNKPSSVSPTTPLRIFRPAEFFSAHSIKFTNLFLLHVNCEGCEYELFESLIAEDMLQSFPAIQVSFHYFDGIKNLFQRYCRIQAILAMYFVPESTNAYFGWERWIRKS
jgi:FkbM family methyltransferase